MTTFKHILSVLFLFSVTGLMAQMPLDLDTVPPSWNETGISKENNKSGFDLSVGTGYSFMGKFGSYSNFYLAPGWKFQATNRFSVKAGALINYTPFSSVPSGLLNTNQNEISAMSNHPVGLMLYAEGSYLLSPRLTVTGTAYKEVMPSYRPYINPYYSNNYKMQGVSVGLNYKLFENVHIGAQFNYSTMPAGFFDNRYYRSGFDNYYW